MNLMQRMKQRRQAAAARPPLSAPGTVGGGTEYNPTRQTFANGGAVMAKHEAAEPMKKEKMEETMVNQRVHKGKQMKMANGGAVQAGGSKTTSAASIRGNTSGKEYRQDTQKFADGGAVPREPVHSQKLAGGHPGKPPKFRQAADGGPIGKKGTLFGKPRSEVVKQPGAFSAKAAKAGESTAEFAKEKASAPGTLGKQARLAETFEKMRSKKMADGGKVPGTSTKAAGMASLQNAGHKAGYKQATEKFADGGVVDGASVAKIAKTRRTTKAPVGELDSNNAKMARQP